MIHAITRGALRLDLWLQEKIGRPYHAILGVGLVIEIVRRITEIPQRVASVQRLGAVIVLLVMESALLIHQVGALSHHIPRRTAKPEPKPEIPAGPEPDAVESGTDAEAAPALGSAPQRRERGRTGGRSHGRNQPPDHPG